MALRLGIDTGGTFTDIVTFDPAGKTLGFNKVSSTPDDPGRAIVQGAVEACELSAAEVLVHGTTVATNAVLERGGARVALVTTQGFRDVLHIQRQDRPKMYDMRARRAEPLVPRRLRLEITERMRFDGSVAQPVNQDDLQRIINTLRDAQVDAVAVGLLHSYANPAHEIEVGRAIEAALSGALPGVTVCLSHELVREHGEYERFSTAAMNAYVQPVMHRYLTRLDTALRNEDFRGKLFVMKSNGGVMSAQTAGRRCVETVLSGPAGGVVAGAAIARTLDTPDLITADMGGTSFDVAVIHGGNPALARDSEMGGLALATAMLDIHTVGAGGGSIGWIDAGGALRVGPRSAGAAPGPACYGRGGDKPTVSDANLVLGRLGGGSLLGGKMTVDVDAARRAVNDHLAKPLDLTIERAAEGMIRVVNAAMTAAIRKLTVERGHDPRKFALCPFGGAGPLHGAELAREMNITHTVVPLAPGVNSAVGLLMSNLREDRVATFVRLIDDADATEIDGVFDQLQRDAQTQLGEDAQLTVTRRLGLRYLGQGYELPIAYADLAGAAEAFHAQHEQTYGFSRRDQPIEIASLWLSAQLDLQAVTLPTVDAKPDPQPAATRSVIFHGETHDTPIFQRDSLGAGATFRGPAVVEQLDATTVIWSEQICNVDEYGQLHIKEQKP